MINYFYVTLFLILPMIIFVSLVTVSCSNDDTALRDSVSNNVTEENSTTEEESPSSFFEGIAIDTPNGQVMLMLSISMVAIHRSFADSVTRIEPLLKKPLRLFSLLFGYYNQDRGVQAFISRMSNCVNRGSTTSQIPQIHNLSFTSKSGNICVLKIISFNNVVVGELAINKEHYSLIKTTLERLHHKMTKVIEEQAKKPEYLPESW
ncbi:MAG: hypothetical protein OXC40_00455 [Proteobacteria bacterium]|nr:hypothetical protein [Pseudomonadota bacterium]